MNRNHLNKKNRENKGGESSRIARPLANEEGGLGRKTSPEPDALDETDFEIPVRTRAAASRSSGGEAAFASDHPISAISEKQRREVEALNARRDEEDSDYVPASTLSTMNDVSEGEEASMPPQAPKTLSRKGFGGAKTDARHGGNVLASACDVESSAAPSDRSATLQRTPGAGCPGSSIPSPPHSANTLKRKAAKPQTGTGSEKRRSMQSKLAWGLGSDSPTRGRTTTGAGQRWGARTPFQRTGAQPAESSDDGQAAEQMDVVPPDTSMQNGDAHDVEERFEPDHLEQSLSLDAPDSSYDDDAGLRELARATNEPSSQILTPGPPPEAVMYPVAASGAPRTPVCKGKEPVRRPQTHAAHSGNSRRPNPDTQPLSRPAASPPTSHPKLILVDWMIAGESDRVASQLTRWKEGWWEELTANPPAAVGPARSFRPKPAAKVHMSALQMLAEYHESIRPEAEDECAGFLANMSYGPDGDEVKPWDKMVVIVG